MTRYDPTIIVKRLLIQRNSRSVYDERFHTGVNVIRGDNSSGKSTLLNFLFYGLGGDLSDWSEHAQLCSHVLVEAELSGKTATLRRAVSRERGQPMEIFGGSIDQALASPIDSWTRYPYARSESKESFSQALFRLLGIPEVANEQSGNLTFYQILRLLYADQLSPVENLFKFDTLFDPPMVRDAVGRLLCGANDESLYANEVRIRFLTREYDSVDDQFKSLILVLGQEQGLTEAWITAQQRSFDEQRANLQTLIETAEREVFSATSEDTLTMQSQNETYSLVQRLQAELGKLRQERDALELSIADSALFINSLERKSEALNDSSSIATHIGAVRFEACPSCYAVLDDEDDRSHCHLCRSPFDSDQFKSRIVGLINDTAIQLKQSKLLQSRRLQMLPNLNEKLDLLHQEWQRASRRLTQLQRLPSTEARQHLRDLNRQAGYLDRQVEDLAARAKIVATATQLAEKKATLNAEISRLKSMNEAMRSSQSKRLNTAYTAIADEVRDLLRQDLRRQDSFEDPKSIEFDFAANRISVDGQSYFSASSRVILKSSFFIGFLSAATKHSFFRHPRFCIIDTIEDKGMEVIRSHNFQLQIARISESAPVEHQIIFATSMIAPELEEDRFLIGKYSTRDDPTLAIG